MQKVNFAYVLRYIYLYRPKRTLLLTTQENEILWQCGQFVYENAKSLINSFWWLMTQHFGQRRRQKHYPLMLEDLKVHTDDDGEGYHILYENKTKTRQGGLTKKDQKTPTELFKISGSSCFLVLFDIFKSKRSANLNFYLQITENPRTTQWYKNLRMGEITTGDIMKNMKANSTLATNHSARKTEVKKMQRKDLSRSDIIAITGNALEKSLDSYDDGDEQQQKSTLLGSLSKLTRRRPTCKFPFTRTEGQVNSVGP